MIVEKVFKKGEYYVAISESSPFYPDGKGGQLGDRGKIAGVDVVKVLEKEGKIFHFLKEKIPVGEVDYVVDEKRRIDISCQHTAQHILSAAFVKVADVDTVGFHMGEIYSTIDLNVPFLTKETLEEVEKLSNDVIRKCIPVEILFLDREKAEKLNLRKPISEKVEGKVRIVKIGDFDLSACGGFHVQNTGNIGVVKISDVEKVKGNLTRIYYVATERAIKDYIKRVDILKKLSTILTTSIDEMEKRILNLLDKVKNQNSIIEKLSEEFAKILSRELLTKSEKLGDFQLVFYKGFPEVGKFLPKFLADIKNVILVVKNDNRYDIASSSIDCGKFVKKILEKFEGKGGGGMRRATVVCKCNFDEIKKILEEFLYDH